MADAVTAILERMVPELEELQERGIFTPVEVKSIVKKRTDLEYGLKKRTVSPDDFVRALEYELNLEALRRRRKAQLGLRRVTQSDHAGIRRIHFIFDRAVRRFRMDVRWWLQWADFCMRSRSTKAVDRVFGRALLLHARSEELWLQAAAWQFDRMQQYATARALMQRALRANKLSARLWTAYFQLELVYVMRVLGRRLILGLQSLPEGPGASAPLIPDQGLLERAAGSGAAGAESDDADGALESATDAATSALESLGGGGEPADEAAAGAEEGGESAGLFEGIGGLPEPESEPAAAAAAPGEPATPDPRAAFFKGMVPRIIYDSAVALLPGDLPLRLAMLQAADTFTTVPAGGGAPIPAFPDLAAYIVASIAADFAGAPQTWELLAGRACAGIEAAAEQRAAAIRAAEALRSEGGAGVEAPSGVAAADLPDDALFVVDAKVATGAAREADAPRAPLSAVSAPLAGAAPPPLPCAALGSPWALDGSSSSATAAASWLRLLASGEVDAAVASAFVSALGPLPKAPGGAATPAAAAVAAVLPPLAYPLWRATAVGGAGVPGAGGGGAAGAKRKRTSSVPAPPALAPAPETTPVRLAVDAPPGSISPADAELAAWAPAVDAAVLELLQSALAASAAGGTLRMAHTAAGVLLRLLRLPLTRSAAAAERAARLVRELVAVAGAALDAAAAAPLASAAETPAAAFEAAERAWLLGACGSLGVQAAVRLGLLGEGAQLARRVAAAGATLRAPALALLPAMLSFHLRAAACQLKKSGGGGATLAPSLPDDRFLSADAVSLSALLPTAVTDGGALEAPSVILGAMLAASPRAQRTADLFVGLIAAASADDGAGVGVLRAPPLQQHRREASMPPSSSWVPAERAAPVLEKALLAGLPKPAETRVREAYLDVVDWCAGAAGQARAQAAGVLLSLAALKRGASAGVCERVLGGVAAAAASGALAPDAVPRCRREFEVAVAAHGGDSAPLWAAFVRFERALMRRRGRGEAGLGGYPAIDTASAVQERAARLLRPGAAQAAWLALQLEL